MSKKKEMKLKDSYCLECQNNPYYMSMDDSNDYVRPQPCQTCGGFEESSRANDVDKGSEKLIKRLAEIIVEEQDLIDVKDAKIKELKKDLEWTLDNWFDGLSTERVIEIRTKYNLNKVER